MLYRIDMEHFLTHAIDHFTREEILSMEFAIISAGINTGGRISNMSKFNYFYPPDEVQVIYRQYQSKDVIRQPYFEHLKKHEKDFYVVFISLILNHVNLVIICREEENDYIDLLCEYIAENYKIECIDLNELFIKGRVGPIYIDRKDIHNNAVDVRRMAGRERIKQLEATEDGRMVRLGEMSKSEKIEKLREIGISVNKNEHDSIDKLLIEAWVVGDD